MKLYHGSKSGIKGDIQCNLSRDKCDFGPGFYMGDKPEQPMGLIAGWETHRFYEMEFDGNGLKIKRFGNTYEEQMDWALFIAYNRNPGWYVDYRKLCKKYESYHSEYDVIVGVIANDKMFQLLERFYDGTLCDKALIDGLSRVKLGNQYVLKSSKACSGKHLRILTERQLTERERKQSLAQSVDNSHQMAGIIGELQRRYRRAESIKFFDEIMEEWD